MRIGGGAAVFVSDFMIFVNGKANTGYIPNLPMVGFIAGGSSYEKLPNFLTKEKKIVFPSGNNYVFTVDGKLYDNIIPNTGMTIDLSDKMSGTSAWFILFNTSTKQIELAKWNLIINYNIGYGLLGSIRVLDDNDWNIQFNLPYLVNNKLYGLSTEQSFLPSVSLDAPVRCILHRGYSKKYPENTLLAYKKAKMIGVNEVEMDISWTKDNIPVNLHDISINRTARDDNGIAPVEVMNISDITFNQARSYEYGSHKRKDFKGEIIPTLEECILLCKRLDMKLHMDRSGGVTNDQREIIFNILDKHKFYNVVWYIGLDQYSVDTIRDKYKDAEIFILMSADPTQDNIDFAKKNNCEFIVQNSKLTENGCRSSVSQGVKVNVWGFDNPNDIEKEISWGVTGISSDYINIHQV